METKSPPAPSRRAYSPQEVARALGVNEATVRREFREGNLRGKRIGRLIRISDMALAEYLEGARG